MFSKFDPIYNLLRSSFMDVVETISHLDSTNYQTDEQLWEDSTIFKLLVQSKTDPNLVDGDLAMTRWSTCVTKFRIASSNNSDHCKNCNGQ